MRVCFEIICYCNNFSGIYVCRRCGHELFSSKMKYKHGTPWPAFVNTIQDNSVHKRKESKFALKVIFHLSKLCCMDLFFYCETYSLENEWNEGNVQ